MLESQVKLKEGKALKESLSIFAILYTYLDLDFLINNTIAVATIAIPNNSPIIIGM